MDDVYPGISEIITEKVSRVLNPDLLLDIQERYEKLGPKYVTDELHSDGRRINACMMNDSAQDAIEEVIDAAFNVCIMNLKGRDVERYLIALDNLYRGLEGMRE